MLYLNSIVIKLGRKPSLGSTCTNVVFKFLLALTTYLNKTCSTCTNVVFKLMLRQREKDLKESSTCTNVVFKLLKIITIVEAKKALHVQMLYLNQSESWMS